MLKNEFLSGTKVIPEIKVCMVGMFAFVSCFSWAKPWGKGYIEAAFLEKQRCIYFNSLPEKISRAKKLSGSFALSRGKKVRI